MTEVKSELFKGAIPYAPDLSRLDIAFPNLKPLDRIEYGSLGETIKAEWPSSRFKGVIAAWRKRLQRERGLHTACDPGKALVMLTADQATNYHSDKYRKHGRGIGRAARNLIAVDREQCTDERSKNKLDHARLISARTAQAFIADSRELTKAWSAPKSLPRPHLVRPEEQLA